MTDSNDVHKSCNFTFDYDAWRWRCDRHPGFVTRALVDSVCAMRMTKEQSERVAAVRFMERMGK